MYFVAFDLVTKSDALRSKLGARGDALYVSDLRLVSDQCRTADRIVQTNTSNNLLSNDVKAEADVPNLHRVLGLESRQLANGEVPAAGVGLSCLVMKRMLPHDQASQAGGMDRSRTMATKDGRRKARRQRYASWRTNRAAYRCYASARAVRNLGNARCYDSSRTKTIMRQRTRSNSLSRCKCQLKSQRALES